MSVGNSVLQRLHRLSRAERKDGIRVALGRPGSARLRRRDPNCGPVSTDIRLLAEPPPMTDPSDSPV
jgi:hypothetical protein